MTANYVSNDLNQYDRWDRDSGTVARERYTYDADGNLTQTWVAGDMDCDGAVMRQSNRAAGVGLSARTL